MDDNKRKQLESIRQDHRVLLVKFYYQWKIKTFEKSDETPLFRVFCPQYSSPSYLIGLFNIFFIRASLVKGASGANMKFQFWYL